MLAIVCLVVTGPLRADPHVFAHRGLCLYAPENTMPAYAAAVALGFDLEIDVYQTKDNHLVLIHDRSLHRTTNGTGRVTFRTLDYLQTLDAGAWFSYAYITTKIPTFDQFLRMVKTHQWRDTRIAINMKTISPGIEKRITDLLRKHDMTRQCFAFAMDEESAQRFRDADPAFHLAARAKTPTAFDQAIADPGYQAIWSDAKPTADQIAAAHAASKRVYLSGDCIKTDPDCWTNALRTNADGLCVNHPLQVREHWRRLRHPKQKRKAPAFDPAVIPVPRTGVGIPPGADTPELLAHRGLAKHAPENTLPAFAAAVALGLSIELDVYQTKDHQLVIIHDPTLDRTTNGTGKVTDKTLAELHDLDAGAWFSPAYAGLKIPTFEQVLRLIKAHQWRDTAIAVNMKTISSGIEKRIADLLGKLDMARQCFIFEMDPASAQRFRDADSALDLAISASNPATFAQAVANPGYKSIWYYAQPTRDQIAAAHAAGKRVWLSGSCIKNDPACWQNANRIHAAGLCTDHPLEVRRLWYGPAEPK